MAVINNSNSYSLVSGSGGDDKISNSGQYSTINAGAGNDSLRNTGANARIYGEDGNDTINNSDISHWSQLNGGAGDDSIYNGQGNYVTIRGGTGNDTIRIKSLYAGSNVIQYDEGDGNDYFLDEWNASSPNWTLQIGDGTGTYSTQVSDDGNDLIVNVGSGKITLANRSDGNVNIAGTYSTGSSGNSKLIVGTEGADNISNTLYGATVQALGGADSVWNYGDSVSVDAGTGNDSIYNYYSTYATIDGGAGHDSIWNDTSDHASINVGKGNDYIWNGGSSSVTMNAGDGNDFIHSDMSQNSSINAGDGDDTIANIYSGNVTIDAGAGNDSIFNAGYDHAIIDAGTGDDTIKIGTADSASVNGGAGNDYIINYSDYSGGPKGDGGDYSTLGGGKGNDTIVNVLYMGGRRGGNQIRFTYNDGDGNDLIQGFNKTSTLQIGDGTGTYSKETVGSDIVFTVGDGQITLEGAANLSAVNIEGVDDSGGEPVNPLLIVGTEGDDSISNSLDGATIQAQGGADSVWNYGDSISVDGGKGNDTIYSKGKNVTISASDGNDYIYNRGVWDDDGYSHPDIAPHRASILGGAGNDTIISDGDLVTIWGGDGDDSVYMHHNGGGAANVYVYTGGNDTVYWGSLITVVLNGVSLNSSVKTYYDGYYITTLNLNNGKILDVYHWGFDDTPIIVSSLDDVPKINVVHNEKDFASITGLNQEGTIDYIDNSGNKVTITGDKSDYYITNWNSSPLKVSLGTGNDTVIANGADRSTIFTGAGNDTVFVNSSNNLIDLGDGNDTVWNGNINATIIGGAGDDLIDIDNWGGNEGSWVENTNVLTNAGDGNDTIRIFSPTKNSTVYAGNGNDRVELYTSDNRIFLEDGDDVAYINGESSSNNFVDGGAGDDNFFINDGNNATINGGKGDDFISNSSANLLVTYTEGDGNDLILGFRADSTLQIGGGKGTYSTQVSGSDVIVTVGDGKITLSNAANLESVHINNDTVTPVDSLLIVGTEGADDISNTLDGATIQALGGDDTITNSGNGVFIEGGNGNDRITNTGHAAFVWGGLGNDTVYNNGGMSFVFNYDEGDGNDVISGFKVDTSVLQIGNGTGTYSTQVSGSDIIINVGDGSIRLKDFKATDLPYLNVWGVLDTTPTALNINNTVNNTLITGTELDDTITNSGSRVTIDALGGDDSIENSGSNVSISGGAGDDTIENNNRGTALSLAGSYSSIDAGDGNDSILNYDYADYSFVNGGAGSDTIFNRATGSTVLGGEDNDSIRNNTSSVLILGGTGSDSILNDGENVSISGGTGDDRISLSSYAKNNLIRYTAGDGNDTIAGFNATSTLSIGGATYSSVASVSDIIINVSDGSITLKDAASLATARTLNVDGDYVNPLLIVGTNGADSIRNTLEGATITALGGNDTIRNSGANVEITGGKGDDLISLSSNAKNNLIVYALGDGNDTVKGFSKDDTLRIGDGTGVYSTQQSDDGKDLIVTVDDESITLTGAADLSGNIEGTLETLSTARKITNTANDTLITGTSYDDTITNSGTRVTIAALGDSDTIRNSGSNASITGGKGDDLISLSSGAKNNIIEYAPGDGNDTVTGFNKDDTLQIDGGLGSYSTQVSDDGNNIIVNVGNGSINLRGATSLSAVNINGIIDEEDDIMVNRTAGKLAGTDYEDAIFNYANKVTVTGGAGEDILATMRKTSNVALYGEDDNDTLEAYNASKVLLDGGAGNDEIYASGGASITVDAGTGDDTIEIDSTKTQIKYASGDGKDVINGFNEDDSLIIGDGKGTYSASVNGSDVIVTVGAGTVTLVDAKGLATLNIVGEEVTDIVTLDNKTATPYTVVDGIVTVDAASKRTKAIKIIGNALDNSIVGSKSSDTILGEAGSDTIDGGANNDRLYGGDGADYITGGDGSDRIWGDDGDDTLAGGAGNDTLWGGDGEDTFVYTGGKDIIKDYTASEDVIYLESLDDIKTAAASGSNYILGFSSNNSLTIEDAASKKIMLVDAKGNDTVINDDDPIVTLTDSDKSPYTVADEIKIVDAASKRTKAIEIIGNALDNSIVGSAKNDTIYGEEGSDTIDGGANNDRLYGGDGADYITGGDGSDRIWGDDGDDTLAGGAGNDSLWGGDGEDTFVYSGGKDVIKDYEAGDTISLQAVAFADSMVSFKNNDVILTIDKNNVLTIEGAVGSIVTAIDKDGQEIGIGVDTIVALDDSHPASYTAKDGVIVVDASARTKAIKITGNELENAIFGGNGKDTLYGEIGADYLDGGAGNDKLYGGDGDDTIYGGAGNDTLWGGSGGDDDDDNGADVFVYNSGDGKDVICDFDENDMLQITGTFTGTYNSGTNMVYFKVASTSKAITLQDYTTETFNVNGDIYVIKGTKLVKQGS